MDVSFLEPALQEAPLTPKEAQIHNIRQALLRARHEIAGNPKDLRTQPGVGHDPSLHMGPDKADDEEMSYCPVCHVLTNLDWIDRNLTQILKGDPIEGSS